MKIKQFRCISQKLAITIGIIFFCGMTQAANTGSDAVTTDSATLQHFIEKDPLNGDNGLLASLGAPLKYGPIVINMDIEGNAIEAIDEQDLRYFDGHYYLYGQSFTYGTFNYSPGVNTGPIIPTNPGSSYRYGGLTIYKSDDLMNWKLVKREFLQDPETAALYIIKKPRVVFSPKTGLYTLWFLDGQGGEGSPYRITQSKSPTGPWGPVRMPTNPSDPTLSNLGTDFGINTGPDGTTWMVTSHSGVQVFRLNDEKTGTLDEYILPIPLKGMNVGDAIRSGLAFNTLFGGIGIHYHDGWWYVTGSNLCGNCIASKTFYVMAKDPSGPWLSPDTGSADEPIQPKLISNDTGNAQVHSSIMIPDADGKDHALLLATRYRSNPEGAPSNSPNQSGDNNLSLGGLFLISPEYDEKGHILPLNIQSKQSVSLARSVKTSVPKAYQAALLIDSNSSVTRSWTVSNDETISTIYPSVFQRTPDKSPKPAKFATIQEPEVNAFLHAKLDLPDGRSYTWDIDPRTVRWAPATIPLNLPEPFSGEGEVTLTLSSAVTNGGYGVAIGLKDKEHGGSFRVNRKGSVSDYPQADMLMIVSSDLTKAPIIKRQPFNISVTAGKEVGFVVEAEGNGLGYQWTHNGKVILSPNGFNEATAPSLRLANVSAADGGTYTVTVFNQVGSVTSRSVTLDVITP